MYEILTATSVVEVLDEKGRPVEEGEIGKIYVISLHNYAMPIEQINQAYENAVLGFEAIQNDLHNLEFHIVLDEEFSQDEFCFLYEINSVEMIKKQFVYHFYFEKHLKPITGTQKLKWFTGIACKDTERR